MELKHERLWPVVQARLREYMVVSNWDVDIVATGTGSSPGTVVGWLSTSEPTGERLIKLWHLLAASGCESPELEQLEKPNFLCGQLLTFGLMELSDLQETIGTQPQAVLSMLRGNEPMRWQHSYDELIELYGDQLNEALARLPKLRFTKDEVPGPGVLETPEPLPLKADVAATVVSMSHNPTLLAAVLLSAAGPLVRHLDSDNSSPEERSQLRDLMGQDGMFDLSTHFNRLCSERARNAGR